VFTYFSTGFDKLKEAVTPTSIATKTENHKPKDTGTTPPKTENRMVKSAANPGDVEAEKPNKEEKSVSVNHTAHLEDK